MFKTLFFISSLLFVISPALAKVEMRWLSVASILLDDGETRLLFDPAFTRPGILHWLNVKDFKSDEKLVKNVIKNYELNDINALFASHSHFDHSVDAPIFAKLTGGTFYVDQNSLKIAKAYKDEAIKTSLIEDGKTVQIGNFKVTPLLRRHPAIRAIGREFLPGNVPDDFNFAFFDYHVGDTWFYLVEHLKGKIVIDQGCEPYFDKLKPLTESADVLIQGVANRDNYDMIAKGYLAKLKPKVFYPTHTDNFFLDFSPDNIVDLPGMALPELLEKLKKDYPEVQIKAPKFNEKIVLFQ